jgi:hypothetical protein
MFKQPEWGGGYYSGQPCQEVQNFAETHFFLDFADPKEGQSAQSLWNLDLRRVASTVGAWLPDTKELVEPRH